jgi:hypothetical protein
MPFEVTRLPRDLRVGPTAPSGAPASPSGGFDPAELQIKVLLPNDPASQAIATSLFRAIKQAHATWQSTATLVGVNITAVTASGGMIVGPPLAPLIIAVLPGQSPAEKKLIQAVATVVGASWLSFTATVRASGLPWYPAFAAVPSPVAPPMPNVPTPFLALSSVGGLISPGLMKPQIMAQLAPDKSAGTIIDAVLSAFDQFITFWKAKTMVTNVIGSGPVPSFAPPYVPVGPVIGGIGTMVPGGFL